MKRNKTVFFIFLFGMFLTGCEYSTITPVTPSREQQVSFQQDIQIPIFDAKCLNCHMPGTSPPDLSSGNSYSSLFAGGFIDTVTPAQSGLFLSMNTGGSMSAYCNAGDAQLVLTWISQGAKNN